MAASYHKHAPWRKAFLIPFWVLQLLLELLLIALLALAESSVVLWHEDFNDDVNDGDLSSDFNSVVDNADHITIPIWIGVCVLLLSLTITEIVLLARHKLKPLTFLTMNVVKSAIWTVIFILDVISAVDNSQSRTASFLAIIIDGILVLCFWIPMIYGAVIYHRFRREKKSYVQVAAPGYPLQNEFGGHTEYPSQYKQFVQEEPVVDPSGMGRRLSYNHQRDTRFEDYRRASNPDFMADGRDLGGFPGSPPIPQVYVEHHD